jgi:uncharacterized protein involved in exopolysaccharide biosynthesis
MTPGWRRKARLILEAPLRRDRLVTVAVTVALVGALVASLIAPRRFRASAHVRAEWAGQADSDLSGLAAQLAERRLQAVSQHVLGRSAVEAERIGAPAAAVSVKPAEAGVFSIESVHADPSKAALLSNRLASLLVEESERAEANARAIEARLAGARQAMEQKAAAFVRFREKTRDAPGARPRLQKLARDYDEARRAHLELEAQSREAVARAGRTGRARFTLLRPASLPQAPYFPTRMPFAAVGVALGLLGGLVGAVLAELRDRSIKDPEDLREALPHPLLAEIPLVRVRRSGRRVPIRPGSSGA